ncbi:MAG: response regulator [Terriglobus sp.]
MERLLLIDDDETTQELLTVLLGAEGWFVTVASSGDEALALAPTAFPQVILSDLQMPGLCGSELAESLRSVCEEQPFVLAMTATPTDKVPAGFDALLVKPFDASEVRRICASLPPSPATPHPLASPDTPSINLEAFQRLQNAMPPAQLSSLYDFALTDAELRVERMEAATHAGDDTTFRKEAHALKGACGMIGAERLRDLAALAEDGGVATSMPSNDFTQFRLEIGAVRLMLEELLLNDI